MSPKKTTKKAATNEEGEVELMDEQIAELEVEDAPTARKGRKAAEGDGDDSSTGYTLGDITVAMNGQSEIEEEGMEMAAEEVFNPREYEEMDEQMEKKMRKSFEGSEDEDEVGIEKYDKDDFSPAKYDEDSFDDAV